MSVIIGIDPGKTGAICALNDRGVAEFHDIDGSLPGAIHKLSTYMSGDHKEQILGVVIEGVSPMPTDGAHNAFEFGKTVGTLRGACMALGISIIAEPRPADWKKAVGIALNPPKCPKKPGKDATSQEVAEYVAAKKGHVQAKNRYKREMDISSRNRAVEVCPKSAPMLMRAKDTDRAEALLLSRFGFLKLGVVT